MATRFAVIGDGGMGTACALLLARKDDHHVSMWCKFDENRVQLEMRRENVKFLPGVRIPDTIAMTSRFADIADVDAFVLAVPTVYLRATIADLAPQWRGSAPIVSVVKGMEQETFRAPSQIIRELLGEPRLVVLTGPSHAEEIARGLPASVVAACGDERLARQVQQWFTNDRFRVYTTHDLRGAELAGALKNVVAIAAGICDGLGFGDNAKSALMTRGLVEMTRFGVELGCDPKTFTGLAGIGDLITTCISPHGRNRRVGQWLGQGRTLDDILRSSPQVAEGIWTARSVHQYAEKSGLEMPVTTEVYRILFENKPPMQAVADLMSRDLKSEWE